MKMDDDDNDDNDNRRQNTPPSLPHAYMHQGKLYVTDPVGNVADQVYGTTTLQTTDGQPAFTQPTGLGQRYFFAANGRMEDVNFYDLEEAPGEHDPARVRSRGARWDPNGKEILLHPFPGYSTYPTTRWTLDEDFMTPERDAIFTRRGLKRRPYTLNDKGEFKQPTGPLDMVPIPEDFDVLEQLRIRADLRQPGHDPVQGAAIAAEEPARGGAHLGPDPADQGYATASRTTYYDPVRDLGTAAEEPEPRWRYVSTEDFAGYYDSHTGDWYKHNGHFLVDTNTPVYSQIGPTGSVDLHRSFILDETRANPEPEWIHHDDLRLGPSTQAFDMTGVASTLAEVGSLATASAGPSSEARQRVARPSYDETHSASGSGIHGSSLRRSGGHRRHRSDRSIPEQRSSKRGKGPQID
jgi:hypothetical protein